MATYTVGPSGRNYTSIQTAINSVPALSVISIYPGTYHEALLIDKPLTLQNAESVKPIIDRRNTDVSVFAVIRLTSGADGSLLKGLEIRDPFTSQGVTGTTDPFRVYGVSVGSGAHYVTIDDLTLTGYSDYESQVPSRGHGYWWVGIVTGAEHTLVKNCTLRYGVHGIAVNTNAIDTYIHHCSIRDFVYNNIVFSGQAGTTNTYGKRLRVEDCTLVGSTISDGIQCNSSTGDATVTDCTAVVIRRCLFGEHAENAMDFKGGQFILAENNIIYRAAANNDGSIDGVDALYGGSSIVHGSGQTGTHWIVRKNIFIDSSGGPYIPAYSHSYNNTLVNLAYDYRGSNNTTAAAIEAYHGYTSRRWNYNSALNNIVINSLSCSGSIDSGEVGSADRTVINNNLYFNPNYRGRAIGFFTKGYLGATTLKSLTTWQSYGYDSNCLTKDPLLNLPNYLPTGDPSALDFSLQESSVARESGTWLATIRSVAGNVITLVEDYRCNAFFDGFGIEGEVGDTIYSNTGATAVVLSINRSTNQLTLGSITGSFTIGNRIIPIQYSGSAPDLGAIQYGESGPIEPPVDPPEEPYPGTNDQFIGWPNSSGESTEIPALFTSYFAGHRTHLTLWVADRLCVPISFKFCVGEAWVGDTTWAVVYKKVGVNLILLGTAVVPGAQTVLEWTDFLFFSPLFGADQTIVPGDEVYYGLAHRPTVINTSAYAYTALGGTGVHVSRIDLSTGPATVLTPADFIPFVNTGKYNAFILGVESDNNLNTAITISAELVLDVSGNKSSSGTTSVQGIPVVSATGRSQSDSQITISAPGVLVLTGEASLIYSGVVTTATGISLAGSSGRTSSFTLSGSPLIALVAGSFYGDASGVSAIIGGTPLAVTRQSVTMHAGDSKTLEVTIPGQTLSGVWIKFELAAGLFENSVVTKTTQDGCSIVNAATGVLRIFLDPEDTISLTGRHYFEVRLIGHYGDVATVASGDLIILPTLIQ